MASYTLLASLLLLALWAPAVEAAPCGLIEDCPGTCVDATTNPVCDLGECAVNDDGSVTSMEYRVSGVTPDGGSYTSFSGGACGTQPEFCVGSACVDETPCLGAAIRFSLPAELPEGAVISIIGVACGETGRPAGEGRQGFTPSETTSTYPPICEPLLFPQLGSECLSSSYQETGQAGLVYTYEVCDVEGVFSLSVRKGYGCPDDCTGHALGNICLEDSNNPAVGTCGCFLDSNCQGDEKCFEFACRQACDDDSTCGDSLECDDLASVCVPLGSQAVGDPHLVGFNGQKFDYAGVPGAIFNLITSEELQMNAALVPEDVHGMTYMGALGVCTRGGHIAVTAHPETASLLVVVNDVLAASTPGQEKRLALEGGVAVLMSADNQHVQITVAGVVDLTVAMRHQRFLDLTSVDLLWTPSAATIHGVLGQTAHPDRLTGDFVGYEGLDSDYYVSSLFGTDFSYNLYKDAEDFVNRKMGKMTRTQVDTLVSLPGGSELLSAAATNVDF